MDEKKAKKTPDVTADQEFAGRIESVTAGAQFRFEVAGKKSGRRSYSVAPGATAMAALVTAAHLAGKKVFVTGADNGEAGYVAGEIRIGAKPKPAKVKAYPKKLKAPKSAGSAAEQTAAAQPAA
jgi:ribosomal protein L6P/L9E